MDRLNVLMASGGFSEVPVEGRGVAAPLRPGLAVAVSARRRPGPTPALFSVDVRVDNGVGSVRVLVYVDGDLVSDGSAPVARHELRMADLAPSRHAITVRAIDSTGRWGGASMVIDCGRP